MTDLPLPAVNPTGFLRALIAAAPSVEAARSSAAAAGCAVHDLGTVAPQDVAQCAALAATLARGAEPILLRAQVGPEGARYAEALAQGLMGYERIFALVSADAGAAGAVQVVPYPAVEGLALILILPPVEVNRYWGS
jgi:hypothetical protein